MPSKNSAQTGWVIAATEGATVDGRTITKAWIQEMADTYSLDEYTAVIWPEHFRSNWGPFEGKNWGTVDEVKASKKGGKLRLFVKLTANSYLLDANKDGQKLFMSIEPNTDFKGSGKCYLQGLAVTDSPASTGTTRLKFSMGENEVEHDYSHLETLHSTDFIFTNKDQATNSSKEAQAKSLFTQLLNLFSTPLSTTQEAAEASDNAEDEPMNEKQFETLMGTVNGISNKVGDLETKFSDLETKVKTFNKEDESGGDDAGKGEGADTGSGDESKGADEGKETGGVTTEQFSQLTTSLTGLTEKINGIETKFNELSKETDNQEPDGAGQGESIALV